MKNRISPNQTILNSTAFPPAGLEKFDGDWNEENAAHLLRRTIFGPTYQDIQKSYDLGLDGTIDELLRSISPLDPPVNYYFKEDPNVPVGATWIDEPYSNANGFRRYKDRSLAAWIVDAMVNSEFSIYDKMTLFWHNHFVVSNLNDARYHYIYYQMLRKNCLGNFRDFAKEVTIDPAMLRYLNGNQNTKNAPNENYARELLELFTIGKGPLIAPGDYTNYTEDDIQQLAKILTGWRDFGGRIGDDTEVRSEFTTTRHDRTTKVLSHSFNYAEIPNGEEDEYKELIDVIFYQDEVARFICRKLYRWFVYYTIDDKIEMEVILPMAELLIVSDYEIKPVIKALLTSSHFYDDCVRGVMIKNPLDFTVGFIRTLEIQWGQSLTNDYTIYFGLAQYSDFMQMGLFNLPTVAGWKAYYQEPSFYQNWLNAVTLPQRKVFIDSILLGDNSVIRGVKFSTLDLVKQFKNPYNLTQVIQDFNILLLPSPLQSNQIATLKEVVLQGLPDYEWTEEYALHISNPSDVNLAISIDAKIRTLLLYISRMPEFQLS